MKLHRSIKSFAEHLRPALSWVLASLLIISSDVAGDWIQDAPQRGYFPDHQGGMAGFCGLLALFFAVSPCIGFRRDRNRRS
jgi:hypothetical protein